MITFLSFFHYYFPMLIIFRQAFSCLNRKENYKSLFYFLFSHSHMCDS